MLSQSKPIFKHRHYEALAEWFADAEKITSYNNNLGVLERSTVKDMEALFTGFLQADNPRFDKDRFEAKIKELLS